MRMDTMFILAMMFIAGLALGAFYFIGLWQTVCRLAQTENRIGLLLASYVLRLAVVLTAFYFLMSGHWERIVAALIGFVVMRKILTHYFRPQKTLFAVYK
jgi:F1F0 ATPase subunit 2